MKKSICGVIIADRTACENSKNIVMNSVCTQQQHVVCINNTCLATRRTFCLYLVFSQFSVSHAVLYFCSS